ncbi:MAG: tRNA pseudouridine(13) synthase TruD [Gemmataceae bacterium]
MKVKQRPTDFIVEELTDITPHATGPFAFYRLDKEGWATPDAFALVRRRWELDFHQLSYGGLKDRHAVTSQFFTVANGPRRHFTQHRVQVTYLGQVSEPFTSQQINGNRFTITIRHLTRDQATAAMTNAAPITTVGIPNYFDDQRFGSVGPEGGFIAREMVHGRFEEALKLALTASYEFDRADQKREKQLLLSGWGNWAACKASLGRGHARSLVDYLVSHPTDFAGAVARLKPELKGLYLSAYQSFLWNRMLDRWLRTTLPGDALATVQLRLGPVSVPTRLTDGVKDRWEALRLPLPSARLKPPADAEWLPLVEEVLAEEGLTLAKLKVPGMDKPFFSKGDRAGCVRPAGLTVEPADDELNRGRRKLTLRFDLPRGSYATMLIKRLTSLQPAP